MSSQQEPNGYVKAATIGATSLMIIGAIVALYRDMTTTQAEFRAFKESSRERMDAQDREVARLESTMNDRIRREEDRNNRIERELGEATAIDKLFVAGKLDLSTDK